MIPEDIFLDPQFKKGIAELECLNGSTEDYSLINKIIQSSEDIDAFPGHG